MVLDNLQAHEGERVRKLADACKASLLSLPASTPNAEAFSKARALPRRGKARVKEALRRGDWATAGGGERSRRAGLLGPLGMRGRGPLDMGTAVGGRRPRFGARLCAQPPLMRRE